MTYQEILEAICRHRANRMIHAPAVNADELERKVNEIEWALQALAEKLATKDET